MSWDGYIDNLIAQSADSSGASHVDRACIIGLDGSSWTTAAHGCSFKLSPVEVANISKTFKSGDFTSFQANGVHCEGVKYQFLRNNEGLVMVKKKDNGAVTLAASKTAVVLAHTREGGQQGNSNKAVGVIVEYLKSLSM